jgi:LmbE family N-acetylglucosaminyl deacetylase
MFHEKTHALAIIAHPDDESFLLAGTSLKLKEEGKVVDIICATRGEKGADRLGRSLSLVEMAKIRSSELFSACGILGCKCTKFFDYPDGALDQVNFEELTEILKEQIEKCQPELILTFGPEGVTGHKDHIAIGKAAIEAAKRSTHKPKELWLASIPASEVESFKEHINRRRVHHDHFMQVPLRGIPDEKLVKVDITPFRDQKMAALKAHESQYVDDLTWDYFLKYECFEVIKLAA